MLYLFYGSDKEKARERASALAEALKKKKPDAEMFRLDAEHWGKAELEELVGGQGLFHKTYLIYSSFLFESAEAKEAYLERLADIADSPNLFILLEGDLDKKTLLELSEVAEKVQEFEKKNERKPEFNIFALTDALGQRDRKKLFVLYHKALAHDVAPEEIHGILFWQLKSILLAESARTAAEAGLKPFVWTKAKTFAKHWKTNELRELSAKMIALYHDAHRGKVEFPLALERLILSI